MSCDGIWEKLLVEIILYVCVEWRGKYEGKSERKKVVYILV